MTPKPVHTAKVTDRRELHFESANDVLSDLERILLAPSVRTAGNWTVGESLDHVAKLIRFAYDGFPFKAPIAIRLLGRIVRVVAFGKPIPAGLKLRGASEALLPEKGVDRVTGAERLRIQLQRMRGGEKMTQPSPVFGRLTHEQWTTLQLRHAELHLSFLHPEEA